MEYESTLREALQELDPYHKLVVELRQDGSIITTRIEADESISLEKATSYLEEAQAACQELENQVSNWDQDGEGVHDVSAWMEAYASARRHMEDALALYQAVSKAQER